MQFMKKVAHHQRRIEKSTYSQKSSTKDSMPITFTLT